MALSPEGSRIANGAALGAALALAFALFAVIVTLPLLRSRVYDSVTRRTAARPTATSWPNAPDASATGAETPRAQLSEVSGEAGIAVDAASAAVLQAPGAGGVAGASPTTENETAVAEEEELEGEVSPAEPIESSVTCGAVTCPPGQTCCNPSCGICTPPGEKCSQFVCGMSPAPMSVSCGQNTCNVNEVCCNASCGICTKPGAPCDTRICDNPPMMPFSESCGLATCNIDMVCCNASCGICAKPGVPCRQDPC